jgi:CHAT domain-containing protein/Tfp pilus assembly protein PilF
LYSKIFDSAQVYFNQAIYVIRINNAFVPELFDTYLNLGILRVLQGKFSQAYYQYGRAKMILDSMGTRADSVWIAQFYLNYGNLTSYLGKFKETQEYLNVAEAIYTKKFGPNYIVLHNINLLKGVSAFNNENFSQAALYFKKALTIAESHKLVKDGIPTAYFKLSEVSIQTEEYQQAIDYCLKGLEHDAIPNMRLSLLLNIANSYAKLDDYANADRYYKLVLTMNEERKVHPVFRIISCKAYADFLLQNNYPEESKQYYEDAIAHINNQSKQGSRRYPVILSSIGKIYLQHEHDLSKALYYYDLALQFWKIRFNLETDTLSKVWPNRIDFLSAYRGKAQTHFIFYKENGNIQDLDSSIYYYSVALKRAELVNKNLDKENNYILAEKVKPIYDEAIMIAHEKYLLDKDSSAFESAFILSERSKASVLFNAIQNKFALKTSDVPERILELEFNLRNEINAIKKLKTEEEEKADRSEKLINFYNSKLLDLMVSHDSLEDQIEQNYPKYYQLKFTRTAIDLDTLIHNLGQSDALLEYTLSDTSLFIFLVSKDTFNLKRVTIDSSFYRALEYMIGIKDMDISVIGQTNIEEYKRYAGHLWEMLIDPVQSEISGNNLVIIPDGLLGYLPFEILADPGKTREISSFTHFPYMVKEYPISYAYSSSLKYNSFFLAEKNLSSGLVSFSPVYKKGDYSGIRRGEELAELPFSDEEAKTIKEIFGGKAYRNDKATKSRFVKESGDYQLIHLAMHALINDSLPMFSELVFAEDDNDSSSNILHTYEIFGLDLSAEMVTLSACNTGTGKLQEGEGIMSLARGFIYAGVPSIVMTLWEIQDKSGYEIMSRFYTYLKEGNTKDIALQKAKLDFLSKANMFKSHPYYWSSYILSGDTSTIQVEVIEANTNWGIWLAIILVAASISLLLIIKRKSAGTV